MASNNTFEDANSDDDAVIYCHLCKTGFSGTVPYQQHLKGSKHKKAETAEIMKKKYGKKYIEAKAKLEGKDLPSNPDDENGEKSSDDDDAVVITCETCKKICTGEINYKLHLASRSHAKMSRKKKLIEGMKNNGELPSANENVDENELVYVTSPQIRPFITCHVCDKKFSGPETYLQHQNCEGHKKAVKNRELIKAMKDKGIVSENKNDDPDDGNHLFARCSVCEKSFSGPLPYQQHMISKQHNKVLKRNELASKIKNMTLVTVAEDNTFKCNECNKAFSAPEAMQRHLQGNDHEKKHRKEVMARDLVTKFPEMVNTTLSKNEKSENDDSDDEFMACKVCHKCFSGPESAKDHFLSKKHLKAKKEKEKLEVLLKAQKARSGKLADMATKNIVLSQVMSPDKAVEKENGNKHEDDTSTVSAKPQSSRRVRKESEEFELV